MDLNYIPRCSAEMQGILLNQCETDIPLLNESNDDSDNYTEIESDTDKEDNYHPHFDNVSYVPPEKCMRYKMEPQFLPDSSKKIKNQLNWSNTKQNGIKLEPEFDSEPIGPRNEAQNVYSPLEAWDLLFSKDIVKVIVIHTNKEITRRRNFLKTAGEIYYHNTSAEEIRALIGLLYFGGTQNNNFTNLEDLWSEIYGPILYRATMPRQRFEILFSALSFSDKLIKTRNKFEPIKKVFEMFTQNCSKYYNPHGNCTVNTQILPFRGSCPFKVYNPKDPNKCGIKFFTLHDSETYYMINATCCMNKEQVKSYHSFSKLTKPIHGSCRNITCNMFTSVDIVSKMLENYSLTIIGKVRKSDENIPNELKIATKENSCKISYTENLTLINYTKENRSNLILSTLKLKTELRKDVEPEILMIYEQTKGASEVFVNMCQENSVRRPTRRWCNKVFAMILDQAALNAIILYASREGSDIMTKKDFLKSLSLNLINPYLNVRYNMRNVRADLKLTIGKIIGKELNLNVNAVSEGTHKRTSRCKICPRKLDRKTRYYCTLCKITICAEHRANLCVNCVGIV